MITCLMGVAGALSCAYAPGGPLSALAARTVALETRPRRRKVVVFMIWHSVGWVPLMLRPAVAPPDGGPCLPPDRQARRGRRPAAAPRAPPPLAADQGRAASPGGGRSSGPAWSRARPRC